MSAEADMSVSAFVPACLFWAAALAGSMLLRGLYAGMETGIYVVNKIRLDLRAEEGLRSARLLRRLLRNPNNVLAVLLVGTNLFSYVATFCVASLFILAGFGGSAEWLTIAVATPALFIFAESVPKTVFQRLAERAVYRFAPLLWASHLLFLCTGATPLVRSFGAFLMKLVGRRSRHSLFGHEGLSAVVAEGRASGLLTHFQSIMADRVAHIRTVTLAQALVPMKRVVSVPAGADRATLLEVFRNNSYSRLPLVESDGQVAGILDIYGVLTDAGQSPSERATPPLCLEWDLNVTDALYRMQRARAMMAVVRRDGKHVGIVTVKDLVEEIVGEIQAW